MKKSKLGLILTAIILLSAGCKNELYPNNKSIYALDSADLNRPDNYSINRNKYYP
ncbi:MAG: hypothetical protein LBK03_00250 [Bacteroidales bacterium]|nr:hypothetical protein [Bacteroidales bacterium]